MRRILYIAIISLLISCIDEINLNSGGNEPKLVVDAWISNDPNLSYVKLYYTAPFQSGNFHLNFTQPDVNRIYIEAENQNTTFDYMISNSHPEPSKYIPLGDIEFRTGESYRLNIQLEDGTHYRSEWQKVVPKGNIVDFEFELVQKTVFRDRLNGAPSQYQQYFLDIQALIENNNQKEIGYYIKTSGIEELMTSTQSNFCLCTCYQDIPNIHDGINVLSSAKILGSNSKHSIGSITMARIYRYFIKLDLYATSSEASLYLDNISRQQQNTGSIFDPMPFNIKGNIKNVNDEAEEVLGYFFTAHHSQKEELISRAKFFSDNRHLDFYLDEIPQANGNCREYYPDAVNSPPLPFR